VSRGLLLFLIAGLLSAQAAPPHRIHKLRITILSTMLADAGIGEWGFAALVEADGRKILFDTGWKPDTVARNIQEMSVSLSEVEEVALSHHHGDHTGGLLRLRRDLARHNSKALSRAHVSEGIFWSRPASAAEGNPMVAAKALYESAGGSFVIHKKPAEIAPGVWFTGPAPRPHPERNWGGIGSVGRVIGPQGPVEDNIPEDAALVFDTERGLVLLAGCGHAGIINTADYARQVVRAAPLHAAIGGFHLFALPDDKLDWTAQKLREAGLAHFVGAHCTGVEATYRIRDRAGLNRRTCVVGAVGTVFDLADGIRPGRIAR
jgi:7,8-dihydropterin-6-yl-methyl-4-(beta-D-ribofuranosyl)aminobenzene 5'-phosphate synthase